MRYSYISVETLLFFHFPIAHNFESRQNATPLLVFLVLLFFINDDGQHLT